MYEHTEDDRVVYYYLDVCHTNNVLSEPSPDAALSLIVYEHTLNHNINLAFDLITL